MKKLKVWGARVLLGVIVASAIISMCAAIFQFGYVWVRAIGSLLAALCVGVIIHIIGAFVFDCIDKLIKIAKGD